MLFALSAAASAAIPISQPIAACPPPPTRRVTCVHDGDTLWINREKIRLATIAAPELDAKAAATRENARRARDQLIQLLNAEIARAGALRIYRRGRDKYCRTLAVIKTPDGTIGDGLIAAGLAKRYTGRQTRCAADLAADLAKRD